MTDENEIERALVQMTGFEPESADLDIPDQATGLRLLGQFEEEAFLGAHQARVGMNRMAYAIYTIREHKLWMYAKDDNGQQKFFRWEDYLRDLADRGRISRTSAFEHATTMRLAINGLGYTMEQVDDMGGVRIFYALRRFVETNRATGEIIGFQDKHFQLPPGTDIADYVRNIVDNVVAESGHDLELKPADIRAYMQERMSTLPPVRFFIEPWGEGWRIGYTCGDAPFQYLDDGCPEIVVSKLKHELHIL